MPKPEGSRLFYITTFGCRTNQADSAAIRQDFLDADYREAPNPQQADVIVVNSCTVTHRSDQQVRQLTRRLGRDNATARIIVTGCYAQREPEALAAIEGVSAVVGNTHKGNIVPLLDSIPEPVDCQELAAVFQDSFGAGRRLETSAATQVGGRTRPFVKIQDGCDAACSYCIIPSVRGPSRSVEPEQILEQIRQLIHGGFQEVVLTGIHIGTYGMHLRPRFPLDRLLAEIVQLDGLGRLRVSSIEPMQLSHRVVELAASTDRIAPHFHICLQSGSDRVLKRMLRPYNTARFRALVDSIRRQMPHAAIGTDVIVGFPGETDEDHLATRRFLEEGPFTYCHVFPYSNRSGTAASRMGEQVAQEVIRRRAAEIREVAETGNRRFRESFLGRSMRVLTLTRHRDGYREGATGNYLRVLAPADVPGNRLFDATVTEVRGQYLVVEEESY